MERRVQRLSPEGGREAGGDGELDDVFVVKRPVGHAHAIPAAEREAGLRLHEAAAVDGVHQRRLRADEELAVAHDKTDAPLGPAQAIAKEVDAVRAAAQGDARAVGEIPAVAHGQFARGLGLIRGQGDVQPGILLLDLVGHESRAHRKRDEARGSENQHQQGAFVPSLHAAIVTAAPSRIKT